MDMLLFQVRLMPIPNLLRFFAFTYLLAYCKVLLSEMGVIDSTLICTFSTKQNLRFTLHRRKRKVF